MATDRDDVAGWRDRDHFSWMDSGCAAHLPVVLAKLSDASPLFLFGHWLSRDNAQFLAGGEGRGSARDLVGQSSQTVRIQLVGDHNVERSGAARQASYSADSDRNGCSG